MHLHKLKMNSKKNPVDVNVILCLRTVRTYVIQNQIQELFWMYGTVRSEYPIIAPNYGIFPFFAVFQQLFLTAEKVI